MKNVVLCTIDALRKDTIGFYGNPNGLTQFIDSLQDKCIRFTKAQSCGPYTQASFTGILTSSYFLEYGKSKGFSPQRTLVSEPLKTAGVFTAAFHSNPYLCGFLGWNRGWDTFYDSMKEEVDPKTPYIKANVINRNVKEWLSSYVGGGSYDPFFLWVHYMDIHEPYVPERKYIDLVDPSIDLSADEMFKLFKEVLLKRDVSNERTVALLKSLYDAHVCEVDNHLNEFFNILEKSGVLDDSVIIITSDHGDEFNEHGGLSHDDKMYSELVDIPLLIYDPRRDKGEVCDQLVSNVDIPPTIIHLFGLEPVDTFEGHSLLPLEGYPKKGCFGEAIDQKSQRGGNIEKDVYFYREGYFKVIYRANLDNWEMYDLESDLKEQNNIFSTSSEAAVLKEKLKPRVRRWLRK